MNRHHPTAVLGHVCETFRRVAMVLAHACKTFRLLGKSLDRPLTVTERNRAISVYRFFRCSLDPEQTADRILRNLEMFREILCHAKRGPEVRHVQ